MATSPVSASKFHQVIRELGAVRTRGGLAALNSGLLFLGFVFALFLLNGNDRIVVSLVVLACWIFFATFAFIRLADKAEQDNKEGG